MERLSASSTPTIVPATSRQRRNGTYGVAEWQSASVERIIDCELRTARKAFMSAPDADFSFGPLRVTTSFSRGDHLRDPAQMVGRFFQPLSGELTVATLNCVGAPPGAALWRGIDGTLDDGGFVVSRNGPRMRRRSRIVSVSGAVNLQATSSWFAKSTIARSGGRGQVICESDGKNAKVVDTATTAELVICCLLLINSIPESTSLLRWLNYL